MDPITPLNPQQTAEAMTQEQKEDYLHRVAIGVDQLANIITDGSPDETISSRMARWDKNDTGLKQEVGKIISEGLDFFQKDHGAQAVAGDLARSETVENLEDNSGIVSPPK